MNGEELGSETHGRLPGTKVSVGSQLAVLRSGVGPWLCHPRLRCPEAHLRWSLRPEGTPSLRSRPLSSWRAQLSAPGPASLRPAPRPRPHAAPLPRPASRRVGGAAGPRRREDPRARTKECGEGRGGARATARRVQRLSRGASWAEVPACHRQARARPLGRERGAQGRLMEGGVAKPPPTPRQAWVYHPSSQSGSRGGGGS